MLLDHRPHASYCGGDCAKRRRFCLGRGAELGPEGTVVRFGVSTPLVLSVKDGLFFRNVSMAAKTVVSASAS